jgi:hypothetical protein
MPQDKRRALLGWLFQESDAAQSEQNPASDLAVSRCTNPAGVSDKAPTFWRRVFILIAWSVALLVSGSWLNPLLFPLGLLYWFFHRVWDGGNLRWLINAFWGVAGLSYLAATVLLWVFANGRLFWVFYIALLIILALNAEGCRMMWAESRFGPHY